MENLKTTIEKESPEIINRKKAIEKKSIKGQPFAVLNYIEFKRVILHISGTLVNADLGKEYSARFVTSDCKDFFYPAHFELKDNEFSLSLNIMCSNNEQPIKSGDYYLMIYEKNPDNDRINEFPCFISTEIDGECDRSNSNPWNFRLKRSASNFFYAESKCDMDTCEYILSVNYKAPEKPPGFWGRKKKYWKNIAYKFKRDISEFNTWLFIFLYKLFSKFAKRRGNIILFASGSRAQIGGNEEFIYKRMLERGLDKQYKFRFDFKESITVSRAKWKTIRFVYYLATSDIIIIDDYYPEIYQLDYPKHVKILQVWHACGAFKTLGFERLGKPGAPAFNTRIHKCYTHVPVSSYHSAKHHAEGFAIDESKFYPIGIPRTDIFFDEKYKTETRAKMLGLFPQCVNKKKVYLYAPTFRGNNARDAYFPFDKLDLDKWGAFLEKEDSALIVKLHPFVSKNIEIPDKYKNRIVDATKYREVNDILFIVDVLITDYSSIIYEMSLLKKPMLFFAFDRRHYEATRDFYEPYEELVPGRIVSDFEELLEAMEKEDYEFHKMDDFVKKNFTYIDGKSTDRVIDQLIIGMTDNDN